MEHERVRVGEERRAAAVEGIPERQVAGTEPLGHQAPDGIMVLGNVAQVEETSLEHPPEGKQEKEAQDEGRDHPQERPGARRARGVHGRHAPPDRLSWTRAER